MAENVSFIISAIDDFTKTFEKLEDGFGKVEKAGESITKVGKNLTTKVTAPIVGMATGIALVGANFDASMSKVAAISGATGADLDKLRNIAKEMGATTQFSASQSAEALQYMALAGWDTEQMVSALPGVLDLAAAGALDLALASDIMTDSMSMFGMSAAEASRASDVFAKAQATSNTDVQQLGEALKYVGATANAAGMDIEQTSAILGVFANNGIKGSSAGTTLDAMFRDLKKSVKDGNITIGDTAVAVYDSTGAMRSMADVMSDVEKATEGMNASTKDAALSNVFQSQALRGVNILMGQGTDAIYELEKGLYSSEGAAGEMAAVMNNNLSGAFKEMKSALEGAALSMYELLEPAISSVVEKITSLIRWFTSLDDRTKTIIMVIAGVVAAIGPLLLVVGMTISIVGKLITIFKLIGTAISAVALGPIVLIVAAVVALIAIFVYLWNTNEAFRDAVISIWENIKKHGIEIFEALKELFSAVFDRIKSIVTSVLEKLQAFWEEWGDVILQYATMIWDNIKIAIDTAINVIKDIIAAITAAIRGDWSEVWERIKSIASTVWDGIKGIVSNTIENMRDIISKVLGKIRDKFSEIWDKIKSAVSEKVESVKDSIKDGVQSALDFVKNLGSSFYDAGKGLIEQMINGIKNMASKVKDTVKDIASSIRNLLPFSPAKEGPLSDLDKLDFAGPITDSIGKGLPKVQASMSHILELPDMNVKPMSADKYIADKRGQQVSTVTNDNRVYITVEGNIDRDLYEDIMKRMAREASAKLRLNGVKR